MARQSVQVTEPGLQRKLPAGSPPTEQRRAGVLFGAGGALVAAALGFLADLQFDPAFEISLGLLGACIGWLLFRAYDHGRLWLHHPTTIVSLVVGFYWLVGAVEARAAPGVLLSARSSDWLAWAVAQGTLFLCICALISGIPRKEAILPGKPLPSVSALSLALAMVVVVWLERIYEISQGTYFHGTLTLDPSQATVGFLTQLGPALEFSVPFLVGALWVHGNRRSAFLLGALETLILLGAGRRLPFVWFVAVLGITLSWFDRPPRIRTMSVFLLFSALVIHPLMLSLRLEAARSLETKEGVSPWNAIVHLMPRAVRNLGDNSREGGAGLEGLARRSTASGYLAAVMDHRALSETPLLLGESYVGSAATLIPHVLWPEKDPTRSYDPLDESSRRFGLWGVDYIYTPITEAYCNFGLLGVLGAGILFGLFGRWVIRNLELARRPRDAAVGLLMIICLRPLIVFETHSTIGGFSAVRVALVLYLIVEILHRLRRVSAEKLVPAVASGERETEPTSA